MKAPEPSFAHLERLSDGNGVFEHAKFTSPRRERGYCTDDMARVLVVTAREPSDGPEVDRLRRLSLGFIEKAIGPRGDCRNRMSADGQWHGRFTPDDCWGRSLWGLGTAAARLNSPQLSCRARTAFSRGARLRSRWPRAAAFASLGAAEILAIDSTDEVSLGLIADSVEILGESRPDPAWPWPEPRLSYANAVIPESMIAAGVALDRTALLDTGLGLLGWLLDHETVSEHLSVTPVGGAGPQDSSPAFDQQPIEVAALADACARALTVDGGRPWRQGLRRSVDWFLGMNDARCLMWDPQSGGGYDGLCSDGPNLNEGAESTLALVSTLQLARDLDVVGSDVPSSTRDDSIQSRADTAL